MSAAERWRLVFDGGSKGNPGLGYGSYRLQREGEPWSEPVRGEYGDPMTNNEAEYIALTRGLKDLAGRCGDPAAVGLRVLGDSKLVLEQLRGAWKVRAANLRPYHAAARAELDRFGEVELVWHRRDSSVELLGH